jgi:hypothetical protein
MCYQVLNRTKEKMETLTLNREQLGTDQHKNQPDTTIHARKSWAQPLVRSTKRGERKVQAAESAHNKSHAETKASSETLLLEWQDFGAAGTRAG